MTEIQYQQLLRIVSESIERQLKESEGKDDVQNKDKCA